MSLAIYLMSPVHQIVLFRSFIHFRVFHIGSPTDNKNIGFDRNEKQENSKK